MNTMCPDDDPCYLDLSSSAADYRLAQDAGLREESDDEDDDDEEDDKDKDEDDEDENNGNDGYSE